MWKLFCNYSKVQSVKSGANQKEGSTSNLVESADNENEQASNSGADNEETSGSAVNQPERDPPQASPSSNVQVTDLVEEPVQDSVKE